MPGRPARMRLDQFPELAARQRIDAGRRLVEDQEIGIVHQRAAQAELLLHAAGQLAGRTVDERGEPGALHQFRRCGAGAPRAAGRTGWRRSRYSRTPTASDRGSCRGPAACRRCAGRRARDGRRSPCRHRALRCGRCCRARAPAMSESRLDLPTPSGPIRPTMRPAGRSSVTAVERADLAVVQADVAQRGDAACRRAIGHCGSLTCSLAGHCASARNDT